MACARGDEISRASLTTDGSLSECILVVALSAKDKRLASLARETVTLVFYEAPHRVLECLQAMVVAFGPQREAVLARELTKAFETIKRSSLAELADFVAGDGNQQKGEIVLLVAGAGPAPEDISPEVAALLQRLALELPAKTAAAVVADHTGLRKKRLYDFLLAAKDK